MVGRRESSSVVFSNRAASCEDHFNRSQQNLEVERQAPTVDVLPVELHAFQLTAIASPTHLPKSRDARRHRETAERTAPRELVEIGDEERTRTDHAHRSFQDIEEL